MDKGDYAYFCQALDSVANRTQKTNQIGFLKSFTDLCRSQGKPKSGAFALFRLLLPKLDNIRPSYQMKESRIASLYLKALGASNAETLKFFEDPKKNKDHMGDFTNTVRATIVKSNINTPEFTTLSFEEINDKLNDLANTSTNHEKEEVFRFFISHLSVSEQIWTLKIILKDLDIHMAQGSLLPLYHPDAVKYFQVCKNLKKLCEDLHDPLVRIDEFPITLFNPFSPQLCEQADLSLLVEFCTDRFWIETKLDGERMQMHYKNGEYKWWSSTYGESKDKGTLAPFVSKYLLSDCESCVLDGEMMALDTETGIYDKFGTLKTVNKDILENKPTKKIIIYVIFDIVYYNRVSLSSTPLEDRFQYLSKVFSDLDGSENVRIAKHEVGFTKDHIYKALEIRMDDFEEGLVAKNPLSLYSPSGKKDWLKIKPEYFKQMNDDVDLLIIGGYYGKGKYRRGKLSTFLCAVLDDTCTEERFVSFCKFGSGFSVELLPSISLEAQGNWKTFDPNVNLPWLVHVYGKENPDMYIEPWNSHVVQVRGTQIVSSVAFGALNTLRFPRFIHLRDDKNKTEIMKLSEVNQIVGKKGGMQTYKEPLEDHVPKKKARPRAKVLPLFQQQITTATKMSEIFKNIQICIKTSPELKKVLEDLWITHGGKITQNPTSQTHSIITDKPKELFPIQLRAFLKSNKYNILKPAYIYDSIHSTKLLSISPKHQIHLTPETKLLLNSLVDKFGDSFVDEITEDDLRNLFMNIEDQSVLSLEVWKEGPAFEQYLERKMFKAEVLDENFRVWVEFFVDCVFYLDLGGLVKAGKSLKDENKDVDDLDEDVELNGAMQLNVNFGVEDEGEYESLEYPVRLLMCEIRAFGGTIMDCVSEHTTHIILFDKKRREKFTQIMRKGLKRIVMKDWVNESLRIGGLANEDLYLCL